MFFRFIYKMYSQQPARLPGASQPIFTSRIAARQSAMQLPPAPQRPISVARDPPPARSSTIDSSTLSGTLPPARPMTTREMLDREYRSTANPPVSTRDYFMGVLQGISHESDSVMQNPGGASIVTGHEDQVEDDTDKSVQHLQTISQKLENIDKTLVLGRGSIGDTGIFISTSAIQQLLPGNPLGEIQLSFADFNNMQPPTRIVKITLLPFYFPHIFPAGNVVFDFMYYGSVMISIRSVSQTQSSQTQDPDVQFNFLARVEEPTGAAVRLVPVNETVYFANPVSLQSEFIVRFSVLSHLGTWVEYPIPAIRILVRRTANANPTPFQILDPVYVGSALAAPGALYTVPVFFQNVQPIQPHFALGALVNNVGYNSSNFSAVSPHFTVDANTIATLMPAFRMIDPGPPPVFAPENSDDMYLYIPKNVINFHMRFSSVVSSRTNDLFPIHV